MLGIAPLSTLPLSTLPDSVPPFDGWNYTSPNFSINFSPTRVPFSITPVAPALVSSLSFDWDQTCLPPILPSYQGRKIGRSLFSIIPEERGFVPSLDAWNVPSPNFFNRLSPTRVPFSITPVAPALAAPVVPLDFDLFCDAQILRRYKVSSNSQFSVLPELATAVIAIVPSMDLWNVPSPNFSNRFSPTRVPFSITPVLPAVEAPPIPTTIFEDAWMTEFPRPRVPRKWTRSGSQIAVSHDNIFALTDCLQPISEPRRFRRFSTLIPNVFDCEKTLIIVAPPMDSWASILVEPKNRKLKASRSPFSVFPEFVEKIPTLESWMFPVASPNVRKLRNPQQPFVFDVEKNYYYSPSSDSWDSEFAEPIFRGLKTSKSPFSAQPEFFEVIPSIESWMSPFQEPVRRTLPLGRAGFSFFYDPDILVLPAVNFISLKVYLSRNMMVKVYLTGNIELKSYLARNMHIIPRI